jgi:hypothetical protein
MRDRKPISMNFKIGGLAVENALARARILGTSEMEASLSWE